jgi:hypothetical protein
MNQEELITLDRKEYEALVARLNLLESEKRRTFWQWFLRRPVAVIIVLMMVGVMGAGATSPEGRRFASGNVYLAKSMNYRIGYIAGASDVFSLLAVMEKSPTSIGYDKCTDGMTSGQIRAIAEKYLRDKPQKRQYSMASSLLAAVLSSCPQ